jgi:ankyrin repeat protein
MAQPHFDSHDSTKDLKFDRCKMAKLLLDHGADPTMPNKAGMTPIDMAKKAGRADLVQLLEDNHTRQSFKLSSILIKRYGAYLLRAAITIGNLDDIKLLISLGADPNEPVAELNAKQLATGFGSRIVEILESKPVVVPDSKSDF